MNPLEQLRTMLGKDQFAKLIKDEARAIEIEEMDKYYRQHPEEMTNGLK